MSAELTAPFIRKEKAKRIVYGPVLIPGEPDSDGDVVSAEKIEDVAHRFVEEYGNIDLMHSLKNVGRVVESYIAPVDLHFGDVTVAKGSWMMGVRVTDDETWNLVKKGRLTGFSIMGMRTPAVKELGDNPTAEKVLAAVKRTTLADLGDDWFVNFVSLVDEPAVPRAKFLVIKSKGDTGDPKNWWERIKNKIIAKAANGATDYYKKMDEEPPWSEKSKGGDDMTREEIVAAMKEAMSGMVDAIGEAVRAAMKDAKQDAAKDDGQENSQDPKDQQPAPDNKPEAGDDHGKKDDDKKDDTVQLSREEYDQLVNRIQEIETAVGKAKGFGLFFGSNRLAGQDGGDAPATKSKPDRDMFGRVIKRKNDE